MSSILKTSCCPSGRKSRVCCGLKILPPKTSITAQLYCQHMDRMANQILWKCQNHSLIRFFHQNARPCVANITRQKLFKVGWETPIHVPYSPDFLLSHCHLFLSLRSALRCKPFSDEDDLSQWLEDLVTPSPEPFIVMAFKSYTKMAEKVPLCWWLLWFNEAFVLDKNLDFMKYFWNRKAPTNVILCYLLLLPYGCRGVHSEEVMSKASEGRRNKITATMFYFCSLFQYENEFGRLLQSCRLMLHCVLDRFSSLETEILLYYRKHQAQLRMSGHSRCGICLECPVDWMKRRIVFDR